MGCTKEETWCTLTVVLGVVAGFFILLSITCGVALCCKVYRFKRIKCSLRVIHCLCCSCVVKDIQADEDNGKSLAHSSS